ncbi:GntR family transcriptional regulator [Aureimonas mangrovi]|uniref:GntR family transcriptional regulator n=1 Tax=Aureimonas mangrovi TaxID=2758041 RepID=UPI001FE34633
MISSGELKPGDRVNESDLAEAFGISRTPMREAIKMLAAEDLLEILPNYGPRVRLISARELTDMLEVIAVLEATAGEQACRLITDEAVAAIEAVHRAMVADWKAGNASGYFEKNRRIHDSIIEASGNETLARLYRSLSGRIQVARYSANKTTEQWEKAVGEHEAMIECLRARDGDRLFTVLRGHIRSQEGVIAAAYGAGRAPN